MTAMSPASVVSKPHSPVPAPAKKAAPPTVTLGDLRYTAHVRRNVAVALGVGASLGAAAIASAAKRGAPRSFAMAAGLSMATGLILVRSQLARFFSEQPAYDVDMRLASPNGSLEIRRYRGAVVARTFVRSNGAGHGLDRPLDEGFHRLFAYISGQNDAHEKIAMTAPVVVEPKAGGSFVSFFLPASRALSAFPKPNDARIAIEWSQPKRIAAVRYAGTLQQTAPRSVADRLAEALRSHAIDPIGETMFAGYDAPYVLPFLRRNEAWIEV